MKAPLQKCERSNDDVLLFVIRIVILFAISFFLAFLFILATGFPSHAAQLIAPGDSQIDPRPSGASQNALAVMMPPLPGGMIAKAAATPKATNAATPPLGKPVVYVPTCIAWNDESLTNADLTGYILSWGTSTSGMTNHLTVVNWATTNGEAIVTLTNCLTTCIYYISVQAFDSEWSWDISPGSPPVSFIAQNYIIPVLNGTNLTLEFMTFTSHTYEVQTAYAVGQVGGNAWTNITPLFGGMQGVATVSVPITASNRFYRLQIK